MLLAIYAETFVLPVPSRSFNTCQVSVYKVIHTITTTLLPITMSSRIARHCKICGCTVKKLSNHPGQVHKLGGEERKTLLAEAIQEVPDARVASKYM